MTDCRGACVSVCAHMDLHGLVVQAWPSAACCPASRLHSPPQHLFSFPLQISVGFTRRSSDCALDSQHSLKLEPLPLLSMALCVSSDATFTLALLLVLVLMHLNGNRKPQPIKCAQSAKWNADKLYRDNWIKPPRWGLIYKMNSLYLTNVKKGQKRPCQETMHNYVWIKIAQFHFLTCIFSCSILRMFASFPIFTVFSNDCHLYWL